MRKFIVLLCFIAGIAGAVETKPVAFNFRSITVSQVVQVIYGEALNDPYVIDPDVLADQRPVSFRYDAGAGDLRAFVSSFLQSVGLAVVRRGGVDYVGKKVPVEKPDPELEVFVYLPRYRDGSYLADILGPLFKGSFTARRTVAVPAGDKSPQVAAPPTSAAASIDRKSDTLVFSGTAGEIAKLRRALEQVDIASGEVAVRAVVYEVATGSDDGSAFSLALNILGGRLGLNLGDAGALANAVTFKSGTIDAAISALSSDSRFKAISTPRMRVRSGAQAHLTVGQDVPTLGAVSFPQGGGQVVQSVEYRSSGVILGITPQVREASIDLQVDQQISDFVKTDTGVNGSPTLTKRSFTTDVTVADGELVVLGGLTQDKKNEARSGLSFLPKFLQSSRLSDTRTELLLLLQVDRVIR